MMASIDLTIERPTACRLYSSIGNDLWLWSVLEQHLPEPEPGSELEPLLGALKTWKKSVDKEIGVKRLNHLQNFVYDELI